MVKVKEDSRVKVTRKIEIKIVTILKCWNSKITWELLIECIRSELELNVTKPTLIKFDKISREFNNAKARYNGVTKLPRGAVKEIKASDVNYYEKYVTCCSAKEALQEIVDEQYALIERIFKNAEELPNLDVSDLVRERPEDM